MKADVVGVSSVSVSEMAALDRVIELNFKSEDEEQLLSDLYDWALPRAFNEKRHSEKIEGTDTSPQSWRMKERVRPSQAISVPITNMKTVSVALVICLNVGVDPPGIIKTQPCARFECWIDPVSLSPQKALETIGNALQKQYERWQPRARYKTSLDPTVDEVKKLCSSLRRNAKDERVLFHYNGHGVPQPTTNGEIWVFNRNYTQYIPLSIYDLQTWMGSPSIYVYDCSNAGLIIKSFHQFSEQHMKEYEEMMAKSAVMSGCTPPNFSGCIQLAACGENQLLPMNPDLPADLFTACLTTPIRIALRWFILQLRDKFIPKITLEMVDKLPGQLNDRRTMLGELNWIFTAITDTIAWNLLPRHLFQKLFRQDLLVASLFRNYLLAERIMRTYDCNPTSSPKLPPTSQHPMWAAWDLALDLCLSQLPGILEEIQANQVIPPVVLNGNLTSNSNGAASSINLETILTNHNPSPFFEEQLTAFQVWLEFGSENRQPPEQLPIVLQVLLSQVHRVKALELLGRFLDLGWWAVNLALSVGIFPYVLKLLQSSAKELRPLLVFIWAKILAVDHSCQTDLVRDGSHRYFISMVGDVSLPFEQRTMAAFVLTNVVRNYRQGQQAALQANSIATCLEALDESDRELRRWVCICLGLTWADFSNARWCGVRDSAHEKIYSLLEDPNPEVRAAAVFALGTFITSTSDRTEHANAIDHSVAMTIVNKLCGDEASPLVRQEIVVALHNFMLTFENNFVVLEQHHIINHELQSSSPAGGSGMRRISSQTRMRILNTATATATVTGAESHHSNLDPLRRVASSSSLSSLMLAFNNSGSSPGKSNSAVGGIFQKVHAAMTNYQKDPYRGVAILAKSVIEHFRTKARELMSTNGLMKLNLTSIVSPTTTPVRGSTSSSVSFGSPVGTPGSIPAANQPPDPSLNGSLVKDSSQPKNITPLIATKYIEWCWDRFARPTIPGHTNGLGLNFAYIVPHMTDTQDPSHHTREWRYIRNTTIRRDCFRRPKSFSGKIDELTFSSRNLQHTHVSTPNSTVSSPSFSFSTLSSTSIVKLHDYEKLLVASEGSMFTIYDIGDVQRIIGKWENSNDSRVTCLEWVNSHDESLIMVGGDDGSLRFWHPDYEKGKPRLVTSWQALSEVGQLNKSSKSVGLLAKWDHERERVLTTGDSKLVRIWDVKSETRKGDWPTGHECPVTSLDIHRCEPNLAVLGLEEGAVRLIDFRLPPSECGVVTWREFGETWIVGATLRHDRTIIAGSSSGKIRFFDLRSRAPIKTIETAIDITALAVHSQLPYFASGCLNHSVNVYGYMGQSAFLANGIREGLFISGRIGTVASVHFHPYKPLLATADSYSINVYKSKGWHV